MPTLVDTIIHGKPRDIGGFEVRRILPSARRRLVGPFIFFDHMGPTDFAPGEGIDVRPHPHIGLATVTYLFEGELLHRDSLGVVRQIHPGDVNWMTAGRGIVHSERASPEARARNIRLHGIQSWIALPSADEEAAPDFAHHPQDRLPVIERDGVVMRLIAGTAFGAESPVAIFSAMFYLDADLPADATLVLPAEHEERAVYIVEGAAAIDGDRYGPSTMAILTPGDNVEIRAETDTRAMLLGGAAIEGKRHIWWNFVSSSPERIERAKDDWRDGRFDPVPGETEFIPLPED